MGNYCELFRNYNGTFGCRPMTSLDRCYCMSIMLHGGYINSKYSFQEKLNNLQIDPGTYCNEPEGNV